MQPNSHYFEIPNRKKSSVQVEVFSHRKNKDLENTGLFTQKDFENIGLFNQKDFEETCFLCIFAPKLSY